MERLPLFLKKDGYGTDSNENQNEPRQDKAEKDAIVPLHKDVSPSSSPPPVFFVYLCAACAALNSCNVGFDIGVNSPAAVLLQSDLSLTNVQLETFMGSINLFALPGALLSNSAVQHLGMKQAFLLASCIFLTGLVIIVLAPENSTAGGLSAFQIIMVGRVLVGTGVGWSFAITPAYIAEISPKQHRGFFTSWSEIGCNVGILLGFSTSLLFYNYEKGDSNHVGDAEEEGEEDHRIATWRLMFGMGLVLPVVIIVLVLTIMVESPRWLVKKRRYEEALWALNKLYPPQNDDDGSAKPTTAMAVLEDIQKDLLLDETNNNNTDWSFLIHPTPPVRKMLSLALFVTLSQMFCGIDAIQYYLVFILEASGITGTLEQGRYLIALGGLKLACLFLASSTVDRFGRRPLMLASLAGMTTALVLIATEFYRNNNNNTGLDTTTSSSSTPALVILGLAFYLASFSLGMGPLGWLLPPELCSTGIRSRVVSLTTFVNRLAAAVVTSTVLSIASVLSWGGCFYLLATICTLLAIGMHRYLPETKGKKLEEMQEFFS